MDSRKRSSLFCLQWNFKTWMQLCCYHWFVYGTWKLPLSQNYIFWKP